MPILSPPPRFYRGLAAIALCSGAAACVDPVTLPDPPPTNELVPAESRTVVLRFLRFDVNDFEQRLDLADLRDFPESTLNETWLLDLDVRPLVTNALQQITDTPPEQGYALPPPARNLWRLLNLTPESANLEGTSLEGLLDVGLAVGLPPSQILADLIAIDENAQIVPTDLTAQAVLTDVISTHPNTQSRLGPVTSEYPEGIYPVAPNSLPVTLADVAANFTNLAEKYGPVPPDPEDPDAPTHPGFITSAVGIPGAEENFEMSVRVDLNALPYKGVDANIGAVASVNSTRSQIDTIFDFSQPDWLQIYGLPEVLTLEQLTLSIYENDQFIPGGTTQEPVPLGNSTVWVAPPWEFEHVIADTALLKAPAIPDHCTAYGPAGEVDPPFVAVDVCIKDTAWTTIMVDESVILPSPPPAPSYFWDILLEVAQIRLHDDGIPEGEADMALTLTNVPIGISSEQLVDQVRTNLEANPAGLVEVAEELTDNTFGDADFYYYVPTVDQPDEIGGDYLFFIAPTDIREDEEGNPVRPYSYAVVGFFADPALTEKISSTDPVDSDVTHEKVRIEPGMTLYMQDDQGRRFAIAVGEKPSRRRITLTITRID
jgi:hypothetical protein